MATSQLQALLDSFEARLSTVEKSVGVPPVSSPATAGSRALPPTATAAAADLPAFVGAFDEHCAKTLDPFVAACDTLGGAAGNAVSLVLLGLVWFGLMGLAWKKKQKHVQSGQRHMGYMKVAKLSKNRWEPQEANYNRITCSIVWLNNALKVNLQLCDSSMLFLDRVNFFLF